MNKNDYISYAFLRSALTTENPYNSTEHVLEWIREQNGKIVVNVRQIPFADMLPMWQFDELSRPKF